MKRWPQIRDSGLFLGGVLGVAHETLLSHAERPTLLILFAAMMGLPAFLRPQDVEKPQPPTVIIEEEKKEDSKDRAASS